MYFNPRPERGSLKALYDGDNFDAIFNIPNLLAGCGINNKFIFGNLSKLAGRSWFSKINIYVKPGYKFAVYARKK